MNTSIINPVQEVDEIISLVKSGFQEFEKDLQERVIMLQHDDRLVRTSTADYEVRGGEISGISDEAMLLLKEKFQISEEGAVYRGSNNGQGDVRADDFTIYPSNVPFLVMVSWYYDEAWNGKESGIRFVIGLDFGQEVTGVNLEIIPDLKKIQDLHDLMIKVEVDSVLNQIAQQSEAEFQILLWKDESQVRTSSSDYSVRGGGREGISKDVEAALRLVLGAKEDDLIDCSDAYQEAYDNGSRTDRRYIPTSKDGLYIYMKECDGSWDGHSSYCSLVKIKQLPPTLEYNNEHYYDNDNKDDDSSAESEDVSISEIEEKFSDLNIQTNRQKVQSRRMRGRRAA